MSDKIDWSTFPKRMIQKAVYEEVLSKTIIVKKWYNHFFEWLEILFAIGWSIFCLLSLGGGFYVSITLIKKYIGE